MALLTALSFDECRSLLGAYGLELASLQAMEAGSVNSNFLLELTDGTPLFARIYEEQGPVGATFEIEVNEALAGAGVAVALPLRTRDGQAHVLTSGKPFAVYRRVAGEVYCQKMVTPEVARAVGACLAQVHLATLGELAVVEGRFGFPQIEERLLLVEQSGRQDLAPAVREVRALASELEKMRRLDLPSGLIHGDLFRDNVLIRTDVDGAPRVAALLDFESACMGAYVYDLMVTVLAWCYGSELEEELVSAMVRGYHELRPLSSSEQGELVREGSVACVRFAATRLTDFSLRAPAGTSPARDFRRFLQRREALAGGALDRALVGVF